MTAAELLKALVRAGCKPMIDGPDLLLADPPSELERYLPILATGLRAILLGKLWHGITASGHNAGRDDFARSGPYAYGSLNPAEKLPPDVTLLIAWGPGELWDRLPPLASLDFPECFGSEPPRWKR